VTGPSTPPLDFPELESGGTGASADEFAGIPPARKRHPIVGLAAAALALFLVFQIREDLIFALSRSVPIDLGDARALANLPAAKVPCNRLVRLSGTPDRESAVLLDTAGSWRFEQFFRLLGTRSRVYLDRVPDPIPVEQAEKDVFVGRLLRLGDLSFADAIRAHFARLVSATHFFTTTALRDALAVSGGGSVRVTDMLGETVGLDAQDELAIDVARPADVQVDLPRNRYRSTAEARAALEKAGATIRDDVVPGDDKTIAFVVTFPAQSRDKVMSAISDLSEQIRFRPARTTYTVRIAGLSASPDGLHLRGPVHDGHNRHDSDDSHNNPNNIDSHDLPFERILALRTVAKVQIPDDALILREGDRPADHTKTIVVAAFLLGFAVLNLFALRGRA
jgi:hypothetical protein